MSKSRDLYITANSVGNKNVSICKIVPKDKQILVAFTFTNNSIYGSIYNKHITRHEKFFHETTYDYDGTPINLPTRSLYESCCPDINNLKGYELIASIEVSPIIFESTLYPEYIKDERKILYSINELRTNCLIHIFIKSKECDDLYVLLDEYKKNGLQYTTKILDCLNCDIVCACLPLKTISESCITNCTGMYRKLLQNKSNLKCLFT